MNVPAQRATAALLLIGGIVLATFSLWSSLHAIDSGLTVGTVHVSAVAPGSPAEAEGIQPGDAVDPPAMDMASRSYLYAYRGIHPAGTVLVVPLLATPTDRVVSLGGTARPANSLDILRRCVGGLLIALGCLLVLLRPQPATWAFLAYAFLNWFYLNSAYAPYPFSVVDYLVRNGLPIFRDLAPLLFAVWLLDVGRAPWQRRLIAAIVAVSALIAAIDVFSNATLAFTGHVVTLPSSVHTFGTIWGGLLVVAALAVLAEAFFKKQTANRQRLAWILSTFAFALIFGQLIPRIHTWSLQTTPAPVYYIVQVLATVSPLALAAGVLYAMTATRIISVRLAAGRALIYGITTALIVLVFSAIEYLAERLFENSDVAWYAGLFAAILIGFSVRWMHSRADVLVDNVLFRRELAAEARLRHVADALLFVGDEPTLVKMLVDEPTATLDLASCAFFTYDANQDAYVRTTALHWPQDAAARITCDSTAIPLLHAANEPIDPKVLNLSGLPSGIEGPAIVLPIKARGDLFGVVFYGAHADGTALTSSERKLLAHVAANAAAAFDHIEMLRSRRELETLRRERATS